MRPFVIYVRPKLELGYFYVFYGSHYKQDIDAIERVQRKFTRRIHGLDSFSYPERLKTPSIPCVCLVEIVQNVATSNKVGCVAQW